VVAGEVHSGLGHECGQASDKVQGFEDDVGGAVAVRCLERISHIPLTGQGQPVSGDGRTGDIAAQPLQLAPLVVLRGYAGIWVPSPEKLGPGGCRRSFQEFGLVLHICSDALDSEQYFSGIGRQLSNVTLFSIVYYPFEANSAKSTNPCLQSRTKRTPSQRHLQTKHMQFSTQLILDNVEFAAVGNRSSMIDSHL